MAADVVLRRKKRCKKGLPLPKKDAAAAAAPEAIMKGEDGQRTVRPRPLHINHPVRCRPNEDIAASTMFFTSIFFFEPTSQGQLFVFLTV